MGAIHSGSINYAAQRTWFPTADMAARVAAALTCGDDGDWTYTVVDAPGKPGFFCVDIRDEDGEHVAYAVKK